MMTRTSRASIFSNPKNVDWMLRGLLYLWYFTSSFGSSLVGKHACTYPTRCTITWNKVYFLLSVDGYLTERQWHFRIGRHGHFKGVFVLVIYHLVSLVDLLVTILRVRTQERICGPKGKTRIKKWELCQTRVEGKTESRIYVMRFSSTHP